MNSSERLVVGLASAMAVVGLYNGANVLTDHLGSSAFPEHAQFHAALGGVYMILLSLVVAWVAWTTQLRRAARGWLLGSLLLALPVGFLVAVTVIPSGSPGGSYVTLALVASMVALIVAVLQFRAHRG